MDITNIGMVISKDDVQEECTLDSVRFILLLNQWTGI